MKEPTAVVPATCRGYLASLSTDGTEPPPEIADVLRAYLKMAWRGESRLMAAMMRKAGVTRLEIERADLVEETGTIRFEELGTALVVTLEGGDPMAPSEPREP